MLKWGCSVVILPVYVNDKLLAGNNDSLLNSIQKAISMRFKASNLGDVSWILSIQVWHDISKGTLFIDQSQYLKSVLVCFSMSDCTPTIIPLPAGKLFVPAKPDTHTSISSYPYLEVIRSLTYAAMGTCPDICAAVCALSLFTASFSPSHIDGLKHIMQYLCGTLN